LQIAPWKLGSSPVGYPPPIVDYEEAVARFPPGPPPSAWR